MRRPSRRRAPPALERPPRTSRGPARRRSGTGARRRSRRTAARPARLPSAADRQRAGVGARRAPYRPGGLGQRLAAGQERLISAAGAGGEGVALCEIAARASASTGELLVGLDALGDGEQPARVDEADDVGGDRGVLSIGADPLDECAVDLDDVDREVAQLAERREPRPEVILDGEPDAPLVEPLESARACSWRAPRRPIAVSVTSRPQLFRPSPTPRAPPRQRRQTRCRRAVGAETLTHMTNRAGGGRAAASRPSDGTTPAETYSPSGRMRARWPPRSG